MISNNQFKEMIRSVDSKTVMVSDMTGALANGDITSDRIEKAMKVLNKCGAFSIVVPNEYLKFVKAKYFIKPVHEYPGSALIHSHEK